MVLYWDLKCVQNIELGDTEVWEVVEGTHKE